MISSTYGSSHLLFGIYEIDVAGTVFYHRGAEAVPAEQPSLIGRNFFETFDSIAPAGELQHNLKRFIKESHSTDEFRVSFCCQDQTLEGRVKLARLRERESEGSRSMIIVDIRKA